MLIGASRVSKALFIEIGGGQIGVVVLRRINLNSFLIERNRIVKLPGRDMRWRISISDEAIRSQFE